MARVGASCSAHDGTVNPGETGSSVERHGPQALLDEPLRSSQQSRDLELSEVDVDAETLLGIVEEWKAGRRQTYSLEQVQRVLQLVSPDCPKPVLGLF